MWENKEEVENGIDNLHGPNNFGTKVWDPLPEQSQLLLDIISVAVLLFFFEILQCEIFINAALCLLSTFIFNIRIFLLLLTVYANRELQETFLVASLHC